MKSRTLLAVALVTVLVPACFSESGLRDEFRDATRAIDDLVQELEGGGAIREAADRAKDTVDEADAALEDFRENPSAETRRALEDAERRMNAARDGLERLVDEAPEAVRGALGGIIDALERIGGEIKQELEG